MRKGRTKKRRVVCYFIVLAWMEATALLVQVMTVPGAVSGGKMEIKISEDQKGTGELLSKGQIETGKLLSEGQIETKKQSVGNKETGWQSEESKETEGLSDGNRKTEAQSDGLKDTEAHSDRQRETGAQSDELKETEGQSNGQKKTGEISDGYGEAEEDEQKLQEQGTERMLDSLELSDLDRWLQREYGNMTFSGLIRELMRQGLHADWKDLRRRLFDAALQDYRENRRTLIQILTLAIAFSILLQMTSAMEKSYYIEKLGFLGVYLILMLLLLKLFLIMTGVVEAYLNRLVDFLQLLQPVFCLSLLFATGTMTAGAVAEVFLLLITVISMVFAKFFVPMIQVHLVLQLVNHMMDEGRFTRIAKLLAQGVNWGMRMLVAAVLGFHTVQGLLAPGIDRVRRGSVTGALQLIPGAGQFVNSMTEVLAGSALLIKNSVGAAALMVLVMVSFLPLVKLVVFLVLYKGCAALIEPVADKRICAAVWSLGQSAQLYVKLIFYAVLLLFLAIVIACGATAIRL